ncbi:MAG: hypothetical protein ACOYMC_03700 [Pirellulales bacterium]|jgi:hypothetical protein
MFASAVRIIRLITLAALVLPAASGCSTLFTAAYLFQPADVPAEFTGLRGKHVAIACRPIVELEFTDAGSARELASLVGAQIGSKVRRTRIIGQQEVARWVDENSWVDYPSLGKSLDADLVVGVDLEAFRLHEGSTLYRGRATAHVKVYEVATKKIVFEKRIDDFSFPANTAIPASDRSEAEFRGMFLQMLSQKISRCFHAYESREVFAEDSLMF